MSLFRRRSALEIRAIMAKGRARFGGAKQELAASTKRGGELLQQRDQLVQQRLDAQQALDAAKGQLAQQKLECKTNLSETTLQAQKAKANLKIANRQIATVSAMLAREGVRATIRPVGALLRKSPQEQQAERVAKALEGRPE